MSECLKVVKVVNLNKTYTDKNYKEHTCVNYYLVNGECWIPIRPSFSKGYGQLDVIAEVIKQGAKDEHKK